MLTVWCVCVGDKYSDEDVWILQRMVANNIKQPYQFKCLADRIIPGVYSVLSKHDWPGWWSKLELFEIATEGQHLYFDLDVVITGNIDELVSKKLSMPKNWAQSGHGGCQSSVMAWGDDYSVLSDAFQPELLSDPSGGNYGWYGDLRLWGDQEFISYFLGAPGDGLDITNIDDDEPRYIVRVVEMKHIYSYKYHSRQSLPHDARVVCFHGLPKPSDVNDQWVKDARSRPRQSVA